MKLTVYSCCRDRQQCHGPKLPPVRRHHFGPTLGASPILQEFPKPTPSLDIFGNIKTITLQRLLISTPNLFALSKIDQIAQKMYAHVPIS